MIKQISSVAWQHINLSGKYDSIAGCHRQHLADIKNNRQEKHKYGKGKIMAKLLIDFMDVVGFMENDIPDKISQYIYPGKLELLQRIRPLAQKMEEHERGMYIANLAFMMSEVSCKYNADLSKDDGKRALDEYAHQAGVGRYHLVMYAVGKMLGEV